MYPPISPYKTEMLPVGDGHELYVEQSGNPGGQPVVFLHGGPGGGSHPDMRRFFDPDYYRIIIFDQRACGKSAPFAETKNNSPDILVEDLERLRNHLSIERWIITGGSWGSTLALLYAIKYSQTVKALILSGIFFADKTGVSWLTEEGGASEIMPDWFAPYRDLIPLDKRKGGLAEAYYEIMESGSEEEVLEAVKRFTIWDTAILNFDINHERIEEIEREPEKSIPLCKNFFHFVHHYYRDENKARILEGVKALSHIPCEIIHGRYDLICPVRNAFELHEAFPGSCLHVLDKTGHTMREPNIAARLVEITDEWMEPKA